jgi:hypothetical protein
MYSLFSPCYKTCTSVCSPKAKPYAVHYPPHALLKNPGTNEQQVRLLEYRGPPDPRLHAPREVPRRRDAVVHLVFRDEILPLMGPCTAPAYPSWMTDDHTPVEFSLILGDTDKSSIRFTVEPSALAMAGDCSVATLRRTLEHLSSALTMDPPFDLEWFDICAEELLMQESSVGRPVSEIFLGKNPTG